MQNKSTRESNRVKTLGHVPTIFYNFISMNKYQPTREQKVKHPLQFAPHKGKKGIFYASSHFIQVGSASHITIHRKKHN